VNCNWLAACSDMCLCMILQDNVDSVLPSDEYDAYDEYEFYDDEDDWDSDYEDDYSYYYQDEEESGSGGNTVFHQYFTDSFRLMHGVCLSKLPLTKQVGDYM